MEERKVIPMPISREEFEKNMRKAEVIESMHDPRLLDMPRNILNIQNGTFLDVLDNLPEYGLIAGEGSYAAVYFDGLAVRFNNLDGPTIPLETVISLINQKKLSIHESPVFPD